SPQAAARIATPPASGATRGGRFGTPEVRDDPPRESQETARSPARAAARGAARGRPRRRGLTAPAAPPAQRPEPNPDRPRRRVRDERGDQGHGPVVAHEEARRLE